MQWSPRPAQTVVLGLLALGVTGLDAEGLQSKDSFRTKPEAVTGEEVLVADVDLDAVAAYRSAFPVLADRRL